MAKGSIRFDDLINVEVAVDPTQAAGAKLLSAVNLVDGQALGGGGGSDFSTAEVTFSGIGESGAEYANLPEIYDDGEYVYIDSVSTLFNQTYIVPLYKGKAVIWYSPVYSTFSVVSGDAEVDIDESAIYITGDCTIAWSQP